MADHARQGISEFSASGDAQKELAEQRKRIDNWIIESHISGSNHDRRMARMIEEHLIALAASQASDARPDYWLCKTCGCSEGRTP